MTASQDLNEGELFSALLDAAADAMIIIDNSGRILRFNRAAQHIFGYSLEEVAGRNVSMLMPSPHRAMHDSYLQNYQATGRAAIIGKGRDEWGQRRNGELFPLRLSVGEARVGERVHFVGIIHDQSQQRETERQLHALEQQLFHAERMVTLGELTAGIAHEINQPLTAIAAYADAGVRLSSAAPAESRPEPGEICRKIADQARRAAQVVDRLRGLVKSNEVSRSWHDVPKLINGVLSVFEHELNQAGIRLELDFAAELPAVFVDEIQVQQIIVNLVKNSIDSIQDSLHRNAGHILIRVISDGAWVSVSVEDNGTGVNEEFEQRLFQPFFTSKPKGFGLGLSICRHIADLHGGSLRHQSRTEGGAVFTLTLPLATIG